jgi:Putative DNA-binding domain
MFDPLNSKSVESFTEQFLDQLPESESDILEYKSSQISDEKLGKELSIAASAFWNSGGGLFIVGVNDEGVVDGGISKLVGRQDRALWMTQHVTNTQPLSKFFIKEISHSRLVPDEKNAVYVVAFGASKSIPHMAYDNKYYIRALLQNAPASHAIIEALWSLRMQNKPELLYIARWNHDTTETRYVNVSIVNTSDCPAANAIVNITSETKGINSREYNIGLINKENPFNFSIHTPAVFDMNIEIRYSDLSGAEFKYNGKIYNQNTQFAGFDNQAVAKSVIESLREISQSLRSAVR